MIVVVASGCDQERQFTVPLDGQSERLQPKIIDHTGLLVGFRVLTDAETALRRVGDPGVSQTPNHDLAIVDLAWTASPCQIAPVVQIRRPMVLQLDKGPDASDCESMRVPWGVELTFSAAVPAQSIVLETPPPPAP